MDIAIKILQFVLSFSLLVLIHEFGHFIFARMFGIRVEKFYLFFNPWFSLFKFKPKNSHTEYGIGWVPFGGYVKIAGMIDESMDTEQMKQPVQPWEFRAKPAWQRLLVMVGGVLMNVVLAFAIYIGMSYTWGDAYFASSDIKYGYVYNDLAHEIGFQDGDRVLNVEGEMIEDAFQIFPAIVINQARHVDVQRGDSVVRITIGEEYLPRLLNSPDFMMPRMPFVVAHAEKGMPAAEAGLLPGDTLVAFNGEPMRYFDQYQKALADASGQTVDITVVRGNEGVSETLSLPVKVSDAGKIGAALVPLQNLIPVQTREYTFWEAIPAGFHRTGAELSNYWKQVKMIFSPKTEAYKSLGGVIAIGNIFPGYWSWEVFWKITAFLSIVLAVMNILPIPVLDGGHVMFLLYEVVTRRKPSDKFMTQAQTVGMIILFALLLFANGNDIYRFFIK